MATTLSKFTGATTLTSGTYFLPYDVDAAGFALTFDCTAGDIIIKRRGDYAFAQLGVVNTTNSDATHRVRWTVWNDDSIGDTYPGSDGACTKVGFEIQSIATVAQGYYFGANFTANYWEINYAYRKNIIRHSAGIPTWTHIDFKNCDYVYAGTLFLCSGPTTGTFQYISYDNTNSVLGAKGATTLIYQSAGTITIDYIYVWKAEAPAGRAQGPIFIGNNLKTTFSYINIESAWESGAVSVYDTASTNKTITFSNCNTTFFSDPYSTSGANRTKLIFNNCLFKKRNTREYPVILKAGGTTGFKYEFNNCTFSDYTNYVIQASTDTGATLKTRNCIFNSNTQILSGTPVSQDNDYNGYYNNGETNWARGANDFTANPSFGNITAGTIDATFDDYIPNGYKPSTPLYQGLGSDTWDNLSIDETLYSPDGLRHKGTAKIWPGIYYLMTTFGGQSDCTGILTLPKFTLASSGHKSETGTSTLTLPQITLASSGVFYNVGSSVLTLPFIEFACAGTVTPQGETGTGVLTLSQITLVSTGIFYNEGTATATLPLIELSASGIFYNAGSSVLTLPITELVSTGIFYNVGIVTCTLPIIELTAKGSNYAGICLLTLPQITLSASGVFYNVGIASCTLPIISLISIGYFISGESSLTLPVISLTSTGIFYNEGTSTLQLQICSVSASGIFYNAGTSTFNLFVPTLLSSGQVAKQANSALTLPQIEFFCPGILTHMIYGSVVLTLPKITLISSGYFLHSATSILTLPEITLSASGNKIFYSNIVLVLPEINLISIGHKLELGTASCTLPIIVLTCTAFKIDIYGTSSQILPAIDVNSNGYLTHLGTSVLTLPDIFLIGTGHLIRHVNGILLLNQITVSSSGYLIRLVTANLTLPTISLTCIGRITIRGTIIIVLPSIDFACIGIRKLTGISNIELTSGITLLASGRILKAGVELRAYNALEKQIKEDIELKHEIVTWKTNRKPRIFKQGDYPILEIFSRGIIDEKFIAVPMEKLTTEEIEIHGKVWCSDPDRLEIEKIKMGENIKDALERDMQLGGHASSMEITDCRYRQLSKFVMVAIITVHIVVRNFFANTGRN